MSRIDDFQTYLCQPVALDQSPSAQAKAFLAQSEVAQTCLIRWKPTVAGHALTRLERCLSKSAFGRSPNTLGARCPAVRDIGISLRKWGIRYDATDMWYGASLARLTGGDLCFVAYRTCDQNVPLGPEPFDVLIEGINAIVTQSPAANAVGLRPAADAPDAQDAPELASLIHYAGPTGAPAGHEAETSRILVNRHFTSEIDVQSDAHRAVLGEAFSGADLASGPYAQAALLNWISQVPKGDVLCATLDPKQQTPLPAVMALRWSINRARHAGARSLTIQLDPKVLEDAGAPLAEHIQAAQALAREIGLSLTIS